MKITASPLPSQSPCASLDVSCYLFLQFACAAIHSPCSPSCFPTLNALLSCEMNSFFLSGGYTSSRPRHHASPRVLLPYFIFIGPIHAGPCFHFFCCWMCCFLINFSWAVCFLDEIMLPPRVGRCWTCATLQGCWMLFTPSTPFTWTRPWNVTTCAFKKAAAVCTPSLL
ncbi:hypothetical protein VIGAN_05221500, partial [Vigna angularis var. angularis]